MPAPTSCRASTADDWSAVEALLAEHRRWLTGVVGDVTAAQPASDGEFADPSSFYRPPEATMVLTRVGRRAAGIVGVHRLNGSTAELKRMYLRPWGRGLGLGRALLAEAVTAAVDLGFGELRLQTHPGAMPVAHRLYRASGFTPVAAYHDLGVEGVETLGLDLTGLCTDALSSPEES